jgi:hypothetical protein
LLAGLLAGCFSANEPRQTQISSEEDGQELVALTIRSRSEWRVLWLEGETDLPDGAYINYLVTHEEARAIPAENWPANNLIESGRAAVKNGQYWSKVNTLNWPEGSVSILVQFPLPPQSPGVVERYGAFGEYLTGNNVAVTNGIKTVEAEINFEHQR